jgi:hypothetical protein
MSISRLSIAKDTEEIVKQQLLETLEDWLKNVVLTQ